MIAGVNEFVVSILNSSASWWFLSQICTDLQNGYLQAFRENLFQIPVHGTNPADQAPVIKVVDQILAAKHADPAADVSALEHEIDQLVYDLYGLRQKNRESKR